MGTVVGTVESVPAWNLHAPHPLEEHPMSTLSPAQPPRRLWWFAVAALFVLPTFLHAPQEAEAAAPPLNWTYRDKTHKFSLKMFRDYEPVPLKTDEKIKCCEFRDPKAKGQARGSFNTEVTVVRVHLDGGGGPVVTGDSTQPTSREEMMKRLREEMEARLKPKDIWAATVGQLRLTDPMKKAVEEGKKKFKKIKSKDKPAIEGKLWQFQIPSWYQEPWHISMAEFVRDGVAYGIFMTCGAKTEKQYKKAFEKIAKSFKWIDKKAKDVESLDVLDGVNITAKKRHEIERSMVSGWNVIVSPKKNYIVIYNTANGKNHLLAKTIAKRIELIRAQIYEKQFPPAFPIETVCIVRVCKDKKEYVAYGGSPQSAGYWSPGAEELVFYDASRSKKADKDTLAVLYHEAFHQYIHYSVGRVAPHSWFNEGHGDYYAGAVYKGGKFKIKPFQWRVGVIRNAIVAGERELTEETDDKGNVRKNWGNKGYTPLPHLVEFSQREYYAYPGVSYAQGWSLIYFLREIVPKNKKYNEKWGHILDTYFDTLKAEVNKDGSLDREREERRRKAEEDEKDKDDGEKEEDGPPKPPTTGGDEPSPTPDEGDEGDEGDGDDATQSAPMTFFRGLGSGEALKTAVKKAFEGVDWEEFTEAWLKATKRGK